MREGLPVSKMSSSNQDVAPEISGIAISATLSFPGVGRASAIARGLNQPDLQREVQSPDQVRKKNEAAGEDSEDCQRPSPVLAGDAVCELADAGADSASVRMIFTSNFHVRQRDSHLER